MTHTVKNFLNVPLTIPILESFEVRGEGVISWKNFDTINADLDDAYSHPRNLAAGSVRKLDASEAQKRMLEFWAFDLVSDSFWRAVVSVWFRIFICRLQAPPMIWSLLFPVCSRPNSNTLSTV